MFFLYTSVTDFNRFSVMALYHTHRPQSFDSVIGQSHIVDTIKHQIQAGKVAHAYLFFGPRGIGKTTTARLLAKSMNCTKRKDGDVEPCNQCDSCLEITRGAALDVIEIDAASHTGVDNVRENIIENAQFKPTKSKMKIFIIDEVHMLSTSAFNALLKTLEEPPAHVLFILATTELHKLPDTIISRCQRFTFSKVPTDTLQTHLQEIAKKEGTDVDTDVLGHIISKSEGCVRDAMSLLEQVMATGDKHITAESAAFLLPPTATHEITLLSHAFADHGVQDGLATLQSVYDQGISFVQFTDDLIAYLRTVLLIQAVPQYVTTLSLQKQEQITLKELADVFEPPRLVSLIDALITARGKIAQSPLPQLPLELLLIEYTHTPGTPVASPQSPSSLTPPTPTTPISEVQEEAPPTETKNTLETKETPTVKKQSASSHTSSSSVSLALAQERWPTFIAEIEKDSPALTFILKLADIVDTNENTLILAVDHTFHRDKLAEKECMRKLESMLEPIFEQPMNLQVVLKKAEEKTHQKNELDALASAFGGEVVA